MTKTECIEKLSTIDWYRNLEDIYFSIYDVAIDYATSLEHLFDEYMTSEEAENYVKSQLEENGLLYAKHCLSGITTDLGVYKINGNGWLEEVSKDELNILCEDIIFILKNKEDEE